MPNTNRSERSTEVFVRDQVQLGPRWGLWAGLRHTRLQRSSVLTDGTAATDYAQSFTTPWIALSRRIGDAALLYASWGRGAESEVVPNLSRYANAGQALPVLASRQAEVGIKSASSGDGFGWSLAAFDIVRPASADDCTVAGTCTRRQDGSAHHRGAEAAVAARSGPWRLQGGVQWLHARREGSSGATLDGLRPTNVPELTLKLLGRYTVASVPGLAVGAGLQHEGDRVVLPDNSLRIPSFTSVAADASLEQRTAGGTTLRWRAGIDNLFDRRAWRESPYQYGHVYLYPLAARTARVSVQVGW